MSDLSRGVIIGETIKMLRRPISSSVALLSMVEREVIFVTETRKSSRRPDVISFCHSFALMESGGALLKAGETTIN